jgi:TonB family protein
MNNDINNPNDPRWTAYALDEITDEQEKAEMDAALRESPEIAALVEEIRETAGWLKAELGAEPAEQLTPDQRANIEKRAGETVSGGFLAKLFAQGSRFGWNPAWISIGATAVLVVAFIAFRQFYPQEIALTTQPMTTGNTGASERTKTSEPEQPAMVAQAMSPFFVGSAPVSRPVAQVAVDPNAFVAPTEIPAEIPPPTMDEPVFVASGPVSSGITTGVDVGIGTGTSNLLPSVAAASAPPPPPPPKPKAKPVPVGGNVQESRVIRRVQPVYPPMAQKAQVQGNVVLEVEVDGEGNVVSVIAKSGHPLLKQAAEDAVWQWKYSPTLLNGEPTSVTTNVTVTFKLKQ